MKYKLRIFYNEKGSMKLRVRSIEGDEHEINKAQREAKILYPQPRFLLTPVMEFVH